MTSLLISDAIAQKLSGLVLHCIQCQVKVGATDAVLLDKIASACQELTDKLTIDTIKFRPNIETTREAYIRLGKKPSRYRPSAEALCRRVLQGKGLYQVNNVVDLLNLVSLKTGFSIGGYDADKIEGTATLGIGKESEPYQAIGRGELNIHNLPLFRDNLGAFGSPTSDSARTMVNEGTTNFLMVFFNFGDPKELKNAEELAVSLLREHAAGDNFQLKTITTA